MKHKWRSRIFDALAAALAGACGIVFLGMGDPWATFVLGPVSLIVCGLNLHGFLVYPILDEYHEFITELLSMAKRAK